MAEENKPPLSPFTRETAAQKVRMAENGWNSRDPEKVYTPDSFWRNLAEFVHGRQEIIAFLRRKWAKELDYRLIKEVWATPTTVSRSGSRTSGMTMLATGSVHTGTQTGSLPQMARCSGVLQAPTTCRSGSRNGSTTGRWDRALIIIPGCPISVCEFFWQLHDFHLAIRENPK